MNDEAAINVSVSSHYREASYASEVTSQGILGERVEVLEPGDLLFFGASEETITHVAVALGNLRFIHASGWVRYNSLRHSDTDFSPKHLDTFISVNRYPLDQGVI